MTDMSVNETQDPGVECPLCNHKAEIFQPFGLAKRKNARCPNCFSLERTRLYWLYLSSLPDFFHSGKKFLHVAPQRTLYDKFHEMSCLDYYPIDKFEPGYEYPAGTIKMDITDIKYPDNMFDFILCSHVLEHVREDRTAMRELFRVLSPSGSGIIQVPMAKDRTHTIEDDGSITDPEERKRVFGQLDHVISYGLDFKDRLSEAGFHVTLEPFLATFSEAERRKYSIKDKVLFIVRKMP